MALNEDLDPTSARAIKAYEPKWAHRTIKTKRHSIFRRSRQCAARRQFRSVDHRVAG